MWTGDIYSIVYHAIEQLDYNCSIFVDRGLDKNLLFLKEEQNNIEFYKQWYRELTKKYIKLETVYSKYQCKHCASHPLQLQLSKEKLIITNFCKECSVYLDIDDLVVGIKREDTVVGKEEKNRKEVAKRRAEYRRMERMEKEMFVQKFFEAMHVKNEKEKERKEKYEARLEEAKKRRARNKKSRERYREKLALEGREITQKRKVGRKSAKNKED